jgi:hypothetical protein
MRRALRFTIVFPALVACGSDDPRLVLPPEFGDGDASRVHAWPEAGTLPASGAFEGGVVRNGDHVIAPGDLDGALGDPDGAEGEGGAASTNTPDACQCSPGDTSSAQVDCQGACGAGKATQALQCGTDCTWVNSGPPGACSSTGECVPGGPPEQRTVNCSCPGATKTQEATCTSSCTWDTHWVDTSSCNVDCCAKVLYCDTPTSVAPNRGTWCRKTTSACSDAEAWADCDAILVQLSCSLHQPAYLD